MAPGLRALYHQERFYLDTLTNAKQFVGGYRAELHSAQLAGWKHHIDGLDEKFYANRLAIELSLDDEEDQSKSERFIETTPSDEAHVTEEAVKATEESNRLIRQTFELDYVLVYSFLVNEIQKQNSTPQHNLNSNPHSQSLPDFKLPTFDGTVSEWITFRDSFKSLIDSNVDLSSFDKFSYLLASLTPEAKKNIDTIDVTAANYSVAWQVLEARFDNKKSYKQEQHRPLTSKTIHAVTSPATSLCPSCSKPTHSAFICEAFQRLSVPDRYDRMKQNNLCIDCLSSEHIVCNCTSGTCRIKNCHQKHHTMIHLSPELHPTNPTNRTAPRSRSPSLETSSKASSSQYSLSAPSPSGTQPPSVISLVSTNVVGVPLVPATVLLQTAIVKMFEPNGHYQWVRALLDPTSQLNLITDTIVQRLERFEYYQSMGGVGNSVSFHILKKITQDLPARPFDPSSWTIPPDIYLADPKFFKPSSIDLLLGMELYYDLLLDGFTKLGPQKPILRNTAFEWVASDGTISVRLLCAMSKVMPTRKNSALVILFDVVRTADGECTWSISKKCALPSHQPIAAAADAAHSCSEE